MTEIETKKLIAVMVAAFPTTKINDDSVRIYARMLSDLEYVATNAAVEQLIATSKWMPTVAEIRERVVSLQTGEVRAGGEAWGSVLKAISRCGRNRTPGIDFEFADPVVHEAIKALGWVQLCDGDNVVSDRARFVELYDRLAIKHRRGQLSAELPAMQRFRALQATQVREIGEAKSVGQLVSLVLKAGES